MLSSHLLRALRNAPRTLTRTQHRAWHSRKPTSSISELQAAFKDPSSPFHLPPGTQGPDSPDAPPVTAAFGTLASEAATAAEAETAQAALVEAEETLRDRGCDPASFWEQRIVWGDQDSFQHVNNVRYIRFFESARIKWMTSLGTALGGPARADAMLKGHGVSLILKSIDVRFRRPVTYPDTLLIGYSLFNPEAHHSPGAAPPRMDRAQFHVSAYAYSLAQKAVVAESREALVWYDYDKLAKCHPGEEAAALLQKRAEKGEEDYYMRALAKMKPEKYW